MCKREKQQGISKYAITLNKAWKLSKTWLWTAIFWRVMDHVFVIGSFALSICTVYITAAIKDADAIIILLSSLAATLTLVGFACNPTKYMENYRSAFQILNEALILNTTSGGDYADGDKSHREIVKAIKLAENYIGKTYEVGFESDIENLGGINDG